MSRYENIVIENKVNEYLDTKLGMSQFLTVDTSLEEKDGMTKKIHRYTVTGAAETVTEGSGNTGTLAVGYTPETYTVTTTQAKFQYTDEADMADSYYVEKGVEALAQSLVNEYNSLAIAEFMKTSNTVSATDFGYDDFCDAIAKLNLEDEEENGFFALIAPSAKASIRKALGEELRYVEANARTGYVGSVCGVPLFTSKAVADDTVIIANKEAVTCFMKKDVSVEQARDIDARTNDIVARNVKVIALTDESKCVVIA